MTIISPIADVSKRVIGEIYTNDNLPTIVFLSAIHGNETSGITALQSVFSKIDSENIKTKGNIIGLVGNLEAVNASKRFIDIDLNRAWTEQRLLQLSNKATYAEQKEVRAIKEMLDGLIEKTKAPLYFVDLHTTSSSSPPFVIIDDTIRNRTFAKAIPATKVLGILEKLKGTILGYYGDKGPVTLVFEAGQHDEESSIQRHISAIWLLLKAAGIIDDPKINVNQHFKYLESERGQAPKIVQTTYRHALDSSDQFTMTPGYKNFSPIQKGEIIAHQNGMPIQAVKDSNIFMPLYQKQGEDGYFIVQTISSFWVHLSKFLRKMRVEKIFTFLPGVHADPDNPHGFIVNRKIATFKSMALLHLFGFRREDDRGKFTFVTRRPYDFKGPWD